MKTKRSTWKAFCATGGSRVIVFPEILAILLYSFVASKSEINQLTALLHYLR